MKALYVKLPEEIYYKLYEYKARWKCGMWIDFFVKLVNLLDKLDEIQEEEEVKKE